VPHIFAIGDV